MSSVLETRTIPWEWYSAPEVLRLEQRRIFRRQWQYVGHTGLAARAGQFFAARAGDVPVVVVRGQDGELRAFVNVCRHRGAVLVDGTGESKTLRCPYHAWTYDLDGTLRAAPRSDREPCFEREELGLVPVSVDTWGQFVFVNPDREAAPLAETLGELPELVRRGGIDVDTIRFHARTEFELACNWKISCENFLECYHCQVAHPGFSEIVDVSADLYRLETAEHSSSQFGTLRPPNGDGSFAAGGEIESSQFHFLFPNTGINVFPGRPNLSIGPIQPRGPSRTARFLDYFFAADVDEDWIREMLAFDDQVGVEDTALVERVQAGVGSGLIEHGRLITSGEQLIAHFQAWLQRELR